jgi:hypothetical protein
MAIKTVATPESLFGAIQHEKAEEVIIGMESQYSEKSSECPEWMQDSRDQASTELDTRAFPVFTGVSGVFMRRVK